MKIILLLTIVALSSATALYGVQKDIRVDNDRIVVRVPGKVVVIDKTKDFEGGVLIFIKEQGHIRKITIDQNKRIVKDFSFSLRDRLPEVFSDEGENKEISTTPFEELKSGTTNSVCSNIHGEKFQIKCIVAIFKKYQGVVGNDTFEELLKDIKVAVDNNECHPLILEILKELEVQTPFHTSFHHFWPLHRNIEQLRKNEDQKLTQLYGAQLENHLNQVEGVYQSERHHQHQNQHQQHENRQEHHDNTLNIDSFTSSKHTDCSQDAMEKQLAFQSNIREIQGQIYNYQMKVQQLQLQQQFLNKQKHHTKLQIVAEQQRDTPTQLQELDRVREELHQKEHQLLETQRDVYHNIHKLQQELTRQTEKLQQCLEDERREDERSMKKMTHNN